MPIKDILLLAISLLERANISYSREWRRIQFNITVVNKDVFPGISTDIFPESNGKDVYCKIGCAGLCFMFDSLQYKDVITFDQREEINRLLWKYVPKKANKVDLWFTSCNDNPEKARSERIEFLQEIIKKIDDGE